MCILIYDVHFDPAAGGRSACRGGRGGVLRGWREPCRCHSLRFLPPRRSALSDHMSPLFGAFVSRLLRRGAAFREASATSGHRPRGDAQIGLFVPFILPGWERGGLEKPSVLGDTYKPPGSVGEDELY